MVSLVMTETGGLRAIVVVAIFVFVASLEVLLPAHKQSHHVPSRWLRNLSLHLLDVLVGKWFWALIGTGVALLAQQRGFGLFNQVSVGLPLVGVLSIVFLDLSQYLFHRLIHRVGWMWRFHRVHHSDPDLDLTTGFRFHPFEGLVTMLVHFGAVLLLGVPVRVVLLYGLLNTFVNFFDHGNFKINSSLDRLSRWVIVTPPMHSVHHSADVEESNANFGVLLSVWDRLFGTYFEETRLDHENMAFGVPGVREIEALGLSGLLWMPFRAVEARPSDQTSGS